MAQNATFYATVNTGFAVVAPSQSATFTGMENTGFPAIPPSKDATFTSAENTGVGAIPPPKDATFTTEENIGFPPPPQMDVHTAQVAWGTAMTPRKTVTMIPPQANATAYTTEGDVTT